MSLSKEETTLKEMAALITAIPDFPKPGILFRDIFPLTRDVAVFKKCIDLMINHIKQTLDKNGATNPVIVGLDARGFIFGPIIAMHLNSPFVPIRKSGKLPGDTVEVKYKLEYGESAFEIQKDSLHSGQQAIIIDDLLATGGTMRAACDLVSKCGCSVLECIVLIELCDLKGRDKVMSKLHSFLKYP